MTEDAEGLSYLQYLYIEGDKCLINGNERYQIDLPTRLARQDKVDRILKGCIQYGKDSLSESNVISLLEEAITNAVQRRSAKP